MLSHGKASSNQAHALREFLTAFRASNIIAGDRGWASLACKSPSIADLENESAARTLQNLLPSHQSSIESRMLKKITWRPKEIRKGSAQPSPIIQSSGSWIPHPPPYMAGRGWAGWESNPRPPPRQGGVIATRLPAHLPENSRHLKKFKREKLSLSMI